MIRNVAAAAVAPPPPEVPSSAIGAAFPCPEAVGIFFGVRTARKEAPFRPSDPPRHA